MTMSRALSDSSKASSTILTSYQSVDFQENRWSLSYLTTNVVFSFQGKHDILFVEMVYSAETNKKKTK